MAQAKAPARSLRVAHLGIVQGSDQGGGWDHGLICDLVGEMRRLGFHGVDGVHIVGVCFVLAVSFLPCVPCRAHSYDCPLSVSMGHLHETQQMCGVMSMKMPGSVTLCAPKAPSPIGWKEVTGPAHTSGELIP